MRIQLGLAIANLVFAALNAASFHNPVSAFVAGFCLVAGIWGLADYFSDRVSI